ncbi:MAG: type II secretion system F family protein [Desulfuromonadaceae bacterium]|nr:type II secretion system F family protein [Desulfuromonadaceae bacterium]
MNQIMTYYFWIVDNLNYFGLMLLVFCAVALAVYGIYFLFLRPNPTEERLERLVPHGNPNSLAKPKLLDENQNGFVTRVTQPIHELIAPQSGDTSKRSRLRLIQAGYRSKHVYQYFFAAKVLLAIVLPAIYLTITVFHTISLVRVLIVLLLLVIGFGLPDSIIGLVIRSRQRSIIRALPDALDLMVICVEAGLGLDMTFKRVGDEIRPICSDLSDEFALTNLEVRAGKTRSDCFKNMSLRTGVPEINNLMTILVQTNRFGTSLAKALRVHSDAMRIKRRQIAEETAAKSTVKLIFPLVCFIFPAIFVVLIGPGVIRIIKVLFPAMGG